MTFDSFNLDPRILSRVKALGYTTPTPIQQQSIPPLLEGKDVIGLAQTGTGKTAAFLLPILQKLMKNEGSRPQVSTLILVPTRELAQQIHEAINQLTQGTGFYSAALYGGISIGTQIRKLRSGVNIIVACPGRLLDLTARQGILNLSSIDTFVLDEADQMFDMGFEPALRKILRQLPHKRQSMLFSATMPKHVRQLAEDILKQPVTIQVSNTVPVKTVKQVVYPVSQRLKTDLLIKLLQTTETKSVLIFTRTKHRARQVTVQLNESGYKAASLQGDLTQSQREKTLNNFRSGFLELLVATDIASRGLDVPNISLVVNHDMPDTPQAYVHRIGRTGRASKEGHAFSLITPEDMQLVRILERTNGKLEQCVLKDFDYKAKGTHIPMQEHEPRRRPSFSAPSQQRRRPSPNFRRNESAPSADSTHTQQRRRPSPNFQRNESSSSADFAHTQQRRRPSPNFQRNESSFSAGEKTYAKKSYYSNDRQNNQSADNTGGYKKRPYFAKPGNPSNSNYDGRPKREARTSDGSNTGGFKKQRYAAKSNASGFKRARDTVNS